MASWIMFFTTQALITSVALGTLKKEGIISVDSTKIKNPSLRTLFEGSVEVGESIAHRAQKLYVSLTENSAGRAAHVAFRQNMIGWFLNEVEGRALKAFPTQQRKGVA